MSSTHIQQHINAPRDLVYRALLDPYAVKQWKVPDGMTSHVHEFDPREGGVFRVSLTYDKPGNAGKSSAHTDTYQGRFAELVPGQRIVEVMAFETDDPGMAGEMTVSYTLTAAGDGTDLLAVHENVPPGVAPADNELGWRLALGKLAKLVEAGRIGKP
jgi:uncharacterized protein YndB with AHSA1/START domain